MPRIYMGADPDKVLKFLEDVDAGTFKPAEYPFNVSAGLAYSAFYGDLNEAFDFVDVILGEDFAIALTRNTARVEAPFNTDAVFVGQDRSPSRALLIAALQASEYLCRRQRS
jgi:hypothetical protein